jgi:hypothetical protein
VGHGFVIWRARLSHSFEAPACAPADAGRIAASTSAARHAAALIGDRIASGIDVLNTSQSGKQRSCVLAFVTPP